MGMIISQKLIVRYTELKQEAGECVLMMQVGAFMQVMNEDARQVNGVTGLKLKMAGDVDQPVVIGGFPKSGLDKYVGMLVRKGYSIAIAEQDTEKNRNITEFIDINKRQAVLDPAQ